MQTESSEARMMDSKTKVLMAFRDHVISSPGGNPELVTRMLRFPHANCWSRQHHNPLLCSAMFFALFQLDRMCFVVTFLGERKVV